jgi:CRP/FNR family transcriptional regulator, cyclic AMP receptor protein
MADGGRFLDTLDEAQAAELHARGARRRLPGGATLFVEGDLSQRVAMLLEGYVKVNYATRDGAEVLLALRGPGDLVGELSALDGEPRSATVTAVGPVELLIVDAAVFRRFLESHPRVLLGLLTVISRRLRDADQKRIEFASQDTLGRVAARLVELADQFGEVGPAGVTVQLPMTQEELGSWVGSSREATAKALRRLRERGLVRTGRMTITIPDLEALCRQAGL